MGAKKTRRPALPLLLAPLLGVMQAEPAKAAETKCSVKTYVCSDSRTGEARLCMTTICITDTGEIVLTNTIVLKEGDQTGVKPQRKVRFQDLNITKQADKASPK